jgi:hypothetical protein
LKSNQEKVKWILFSLQERPKENNASQRIKVNLYARCILAFIKLNLLFFYQLFFLLSKKKKFENYIILGSLSPHHHGNLKRFFGLDISQEKIIQAFEIKSIVSNEFIGLIPLYLEFFRHFSSARRYICFENKVYSAKELVANLSSAIAIYSYFCLLFKLIKDRDSTMEIYTGGAELASLAAISNGLTTHYMTHGLLGLSALPEIGPQAFKEQKFSEDSFPSFSSIYVYSMEEQLYLTKRLPSAKINVYPFKPLSSQQKTIILFFDDAKQFFDAMLFQKIVDFFNAENFKIIGKEHPCNTSNLPEIFCQENNIELLKGSSLSAYEVIIQYKPKFVLGWPSTSLCESLNLGVIPICIPDTHPFFEFQNFYPFQSKTLAWSKDLNIIKSVMHSKEAYAQKLIILNLTES